MRREYRGAVGQVDGRPIRLVTRPRHIKATSTKGESPAMAGRSRVTESVHKRLVFRSA